MSGNLKVVPLREDWKVVWVNCGTYGSGSYGEPMQGPVLHAFLVTHSNSLEVLLRVNVSQQQLEKELRKLLQWIDEGLLDKLEQDLPPDPRGVEHFGY